VVPSPVAVAPPCADAQLVGIRTVWVFDWRAWNVALKRKAPYPFATAMKS